MLHDRSGPRQDTNCVPATDACGWPGNAGTTTGMPDLDDDLLDYPSTPVRHSPTPHLTPREKEIIFWISRGKTDWQMAQILEISAKTVNFHVERVKSKLDAATRAQAANIAMRSGLLFESEPECPDLPNGNPADLGMVPLRCPSHKEWTSPRDFRNSPVYAALPAMPNPGIPIGSRSVAVGSWYNSLGTK